MSWKSSNFPRADDSNDVGWLISYWRVVKCEGGCQGDYQLESRQFDHLVKAATKKQALIKFQTYIDNRREAGDRIDIKGLTLFLSKVVAIEPILDNRGKLVK